MSSSSWGDWSAISSEAGTHVHDNGRLTPKAFWSSRGCPPSTGPEWEGVRGRMISKGGPAALHPSHPGLLSRSVAPASLVWQRLQDAVSANGECAGPPNGGPGLARLPAPGFEGWRRPEPRARAPAEGCLEGSVWGRAAPDQWSPWPVIPGQERARRTVPSKAEGQDHPPVGLEALDLLRTCHPAFFFNLSLLEWECPPYACPSAVFWKHTACCKHAGPYGAFRGQASYPHPVLYISCIASHL